MKSKFFAIILIVIFSMQLFSQNNEADTILVIRDDFYLEVVKTDDELYIYSDSDKYIMSQSPLSSFNEFKKIYQNHNFPKYPVLITDAYGATGFDDKIFQCIWLIKNKQLYLCDILFNDKEFDDKEKGRKDQFSIMEKFTGEKFETQYNYISLGGRKIHGLMHATWFTDTLFVKKAFTHQRGLDYENYEKNFEKWVKSAYLQLIFEKGILMDMKGIPNETKKSVFVRPKKTKVKPN